MSVRIAVATVSGKAYYLIVNELKRKRIPFLSLTPEESIPIEVKVVITTQEEEGLIRHEKVLAYRLGTEPEALINEALHIIQGKEALDRIVIGVDPGQVFGIAVIAGGKILETENCYSLGDTVSRIETIVHDLENVTASSISVKIGDGVPECTENLLRALDKSLPLRVMLESVREAGTNSSLHEAKHRRGLRDIVSAIQIAGRSGQAFHRREPDETYG